MSNEKDAIMTDDEFAEIEKNIREIKRLTNDALNRTRSAEAMLIKAQAEEEGKGEMMSNEELVEAIDNRRLEPPDEPDPVCRCDYCDAPMYEGDEKWTIGFDTICGECARNNYMEVIRSDY